MTSQSGADNAPKIIRRGPRVRLETPVQVESAGNEGPPFRVEGKTVEVAVRGGRLVLPLMIDVGRSVIVANPRTNKKVECQVRSAEQAEPGVYHVGIEFAAPSPKFWGIGFPADDWNPSERKLPSAAGLATNAAQAAAPRDASARASTEGATKTAATAAAGVSAAPAEPAKNSTPSLQRWYVLAWAGAVLAIVLALVVFWTGKTSAPPSAAPDAASSSVTEGIAPADARLIPNLGNFRLAAERDFDPLAASWLRHLGQQPSGDIPGRYSGTGQSHAYILIGKEHERRVVIVAGGHVRCDAEYRTIAIAAHVPKEFLPGISWDDSSPIESEGDGLLVVRSASDPGSGVVLLLSGDQVVTRAPVDFHQIPVGLAP